MDDARHELVRRLLERRGIVLPAQEPISVRPDRPAVLSLPQQRLWFVHQLYPNSSAYNLSAGLRLSGSLDRPALERALASIAARHDALRSGFPTVDGEAVAVVHPHVTLAVVYHDFADADPLEGEARLREVLTAQAHGPFDLAHAPLVRAALVRLAPDEHVLAITAHHIVFDGWSIAILIRELAAFYGAALAGVAPDLPHLPISYADFAAWQRERQASGAWEAGVAYWTRQLADLTPTMLPSDRLRAAQTSLRGSSLRFVLPAGLVDRLRDIGRTHDATLFMTLLAGFFVLLGRYTRQSDVAVGSPIAGRARQDVEGLIGLVANMLVLRGDLSGRPSFPELLRRVRRTTLDAFTHGDAPFEAVVDRLQPDRRLRQQPLFQVAFALQHESIGALALAGLDVSVVDIPSASSKFDLTLALTEERAGISCVAEFSTDCSMPRPLTASPAITARCSRTSSSTRIGQSISCRCCPRPSGRPCSVTSSGQRHSRQSPACCTRPSSIRSASGQVRWPSSMAPRH
jgi:hypothetical protein